MAAEGSDSGHTDSGRPGSGGAEDVEFELQPRDRTERFMADDDDLVITKKADVKRPTPPPEQSEQ